MSRHTGWGSKVSRPPRDPDDNAVFSSDGRVDPASVDVAAKVGRKRRNRPDPPDELRKWEAPAEKRMMTRPYPPNVILEPAGMDEEYWTSPHSDVDLWALQLGECFGTRSRSTINTFMRQLQALCDKSHWDDESQQWRLSEDEYSAMLAIINGLKPRNELEAAHAAQMVAVHLLTMKVAARAIKYDYDTRTAAAAGKLARTFNLQREAFDRLRKPNRTARQSIKVSKETHHHHHIHVHRHRGDGRSEGEPDAKDGGELRNETAQGAEGLPALPCSEEVGRGVVPFPGDAERALSASRRAKSGRAKG